MTSTVTRKYSDLAIEDLHVAGLMRGRTPRAQADAGMGDIKRQLIYKGQWRHTKVILAPMWFPSSKTCSACGTVNANLKREPRWTCPSCGAQHERNLNAAINLRNLIIPAGRGRTGRSNKEVPRQGPRASCEGEPGIVKDVPPLWECEPGTDTGTQVDRPRRGTGNHRKPTVAINQGNFVIASGRHRDGRDQEAERPATFFGAVNANLEWTWISEDRRPQAWKQGSPKADHGNQPDKNDHASRLTPQWARLG